MNKHLGTILAPALCLILANVCLAKQNVLFYRVTNYDQPGPLGRLYQREFERRMFSQQTWRQRLYYHSYDPDVNETIEIYAKPDESRWLRHRSANPSLSKIIRDHVHGQQFDLKKRLDGVHITSCEVPLPSELAKELEMLWEMMLPGVSEAPRPRDLSVHAPIFIGFARESGSVKTGSIAIAAYNTPIYRSFVDIVRDLREVCDRGAGSTETVLRALPSKIRSLRTRLRG